MGFAFAWRAVAFLLLGLFSVVSAAQAQSGLADIKKNASALAQQYAEVDAMLADTDKNRRIGAMIALLGSADPIYQKRARDVGLFSPDPEMRIMALRAILDTGGPFTIEMDLKGISEEKTRIFKYLREEGGNWDDGTGIGSRVIRLGAFNPKLGCWVQPRYDTQCIVYLSGDSVTVYVNRATAKFRLSNEGVLAGTFRYNYVCGACDPVPAQINLVR